MKYILLLVAIVTIDGCVVVPYEGHYRVHSNYNYTNHSMHDFHHRR